MGFAGIAGSVIGSMMGGMGSGVSSMISGGSGQADQLLGQLGDAQNMTLEKTLRSQIQTMIHDMLMSIAKNFHN